MKERPDTPEVVLDSASRLPTCGATEIRAPETPLLCEA